MIDRFGSTVDAQALDPRADATPVLVVLGPTGARTLPTPEGGALTVGRHVDNDLQLDDPLVSRRHARLRFGPGRVTVEDLGGANGTRLSGARLPSGAEVTLAVGAPIQVGGTVIVLRDGPPAPRPPARALVRSARMRALYEEAASVARGRLSVLVLGETGVGKEVLAREVHARSPRAARPFVAVNCGALAGSLLDSELFGHEAGAFTGAERAKPGLVEAAHGGSLFLDEVGELPAAMQVKLLRVLANREILRVGAVEPRAVDVRVISATNRDLEAEVRAGRFREDLFYRLAGATLVVPPLRARPEEIVPFAERFAGLAAEDAELPAPTFDEAAKARLLAHTWPGNLRELDNAVTRAVLLASDGTIAPRHLPEPSADAAGAPPGELSEAQADERARIAQALEAHAGNQTRAAAALGISRQTLSKKLDRYGLPRPRK